jgi:hypothetical protein
MGLSKLIIQSLVFFLALSSMRLVSMFSSKIIRHIGVSSIHHVNSIYLRAFNQNIQKSHFFCNGMTQLKTKFLSIRLLSSSLSDSDSNSASADRKKQIAKLLKRSLSIKNKKVNENADIDAKINLPDKDTVPSSIAVESIPNINLFRNLKVSENTKKALAEVMKYDKMTPVQAESIPEILLGKDVFVKAKTGTGKTLGFLIPSIEVLIEERARYAKLVRSITRESGSSAIPPAPVVLILSPTRELALQIAQEAKELCTFHKLNVVTLVGASILF